MKGHIECFCDECYCVVGDERFVGIDACECIEDKIVKIKSGNYTGENAIFQKIDVSDGTHNVFSKSSFTKPCERL